MTYTNQELANLFLKPQTSLQKQYEALRARFVEQKPWAEIAEQFDLNPGTLRNLASKVRKSGTLSPFESPNTQKRAQRDQRILELRLKENLSDAEIAEQLAAEGIKAGTTLIGTVLRNAGISKLPRRMARKVPKVLKASEADVRQFLPTSEKWQTRFGGLFLFVRDLEQAGLHQWLSNWPGSKKLPAPTLIRALLALKLWGIGRPYQVMPDILDRGSALFAGLNVMPKKSTLTEYSTRIDAPHLRTLMEAWHGVAQGLLPAPKESFDLDFHTIPYHGDEALMEKHFVSKRSRRQRGGLAMVAREASQRALIYGDTRITKASQNDAILEFVQLWEQRAGQPPKELVFDSRFTIYANLAELNERNIYFLTLRRRGPSVVHQLNQRPPEDWKTIRLSNIARKYANPHVLDESISLRNYSKPLRQIAIKGLGHDKPTLLITNRMKGKSAALVDRYARRMLVENAIEDAINFFHMDALSSTVPLRIDLDLQLTLIASTLYQVLAQRLGPRYQTAKSRTIFNKFVNAPATIISQNDQIVVRLTRRAHNTELRAAGYVGAQGPISWMQDRNLIIEYV